MWTDLTLSWRRLRNAPGFTAATVLTLALAIGSNGALFSALYTVLLGPQTVRAPNDLVVGWANDSSNAPIVELSYDEFRRLATDSRSFEEMAALGSSNWPVILENRRDGGAIRLSSAGVSGSFFKALGAAALLGRTLDFADDLPRAQRVAVLSHRAWVGHFGADSTVLGQTLRLDGTSHAVVGVMTPAVDFPRGTDLWIPVVPVLTNSARSTGDALRDVGVLFVVGRLRPGVTAQMASHALTALHSQGAASVITGTPAATIEVTPFLEYTLGPVRPALWSLFGAVTVLLLIACANVSGLMLTRLTIYRKEHAIRLALGSTSARLARVWVFEAMLLAAAGGAFGFVVLHWLGRGIALLAPEGVLQAGSLSINGPIVAFTLVLTLAAILLCCAGPIRQVSITARDRISPSGPTERVAQFYERRSALVVLQVGLAVVVLVASGLVVRSFVALRAIPLGFEPSGVLTMNVTPRDMPSSPNAWMDQLLMRVSALPGVEAAGAVYLTPLALGHIGQEATVLLYGQGPGAGIATENPTLNYQVASPGYFPAMQIELLAGRLFDTGDDQRAPRVTIVGESTARRLWPGQDPIGQRLDLLGVSAHGGWRTVVGVVSDVRYRGLQDQRLDIYEPALQAELVANDVVIKTIGNPLAIAAAVQTEARKAASGVVLERVATLDAIVARPLAPWRLATWMLTLFAMAAVGLAFLGSFSLVMLDVAARRHDFAVRLAVGAQRHHIVQFVLARVAWTSAVGVGLGLLVSFAVTQVLKALLFGVRPLDAPTYSAVSILMLMVVGVPGYVAARRAAATEPLSLMRGDR